MPSQELIDRISAIEAGITKSQAWLAHLRQLAENPPAPEPGFKVVKLTGGWDSPSINTFYRSSYPSRGLEYAIVPDECPEDECTGFESRDEEDKILPHKGGSYPIAGDGLSPEEAWEDAKANNFGREE